MESQIKLKKAICSGYYGFDNFGDEAVLQVLIKRLRDKYDFTVFSTSPDKTSRCHNVKSIYSFDYTSIINAIKNTDVLFSGGGSLLQDVTSFKSILYYLLIIYFAILFQKDVIIFAQGIGPLKSIFSQILVKNALRQCKLVTVRDKESLELLNKWNINATLIDDPVFTIPIPEVKRSNKIGIQLRSFEGVNEQFLNELASQINTFYKDKDIILISLQDKLDLKVCNKFASLLNTKSVEIKSNLCVNDAIEEIAKLETLIAMRFHAALIGFRAGVKVLPIAYDKKVEILANKANVDYVKVSEINKISNKIKSLNNINTEQIKKQFNQANFDVSIFDI